MRRSQQHSKIRVRTVVAAILVAALCTGLALAAYDDDQSSQQGQQYQDRQQSSSMQSQDQDTWQQQGQQSGMSQGRNQQLERQVASELRQQGFGQNGQIMVLALGDRVILLGTVPDQQQKDQITQTTHQISGVQQVDDRLHVSTGSGRESDSQLRRQIEQQLQNQTAAGQNVQVQVRNGRVTLNGRVDNWQEVADVLDTAFASGARNVTSQLTTSVGQSPMSQSDRGYQSGMGQGSQTDRGYYPPYGYTPGQGDQSQWQDQSGYGQQRQGRMGQGRQQWEQQSGMGMQQQGGQQMSASDLALAQRVAMQLQQQVGTAETVHVMDPRAIYVHVSQGTVKLYGAVQDNSQRQQAEQIARSIRGVQNVQNQLRIASQGGEYQTFGYVPGQSSQSQNRSQWGSGSQQGQTGGMGSQYDRSQWGTSGQGQTGGTSGMSGMGGQSGRSGSSQSQYGGTSGQSDQSQWNGADSQDQTSDTSGTSGMSGQSDQSQSGTTGSGQAPYGSTSGQSSSNKSGISSSGQSQSGSSASQSGQSQYAQSKSGIGSSSRSQTGSGQYSQSGATAGQSSSTFGGQSSATQQQSTGDYPALGYVPGQERQQQQMGQGQGGANDKVLAHRIAMQLQQQLSSGQMVYVMDPDAIYVHAAQGTVTLLGSVNDQNQKEQAEQAIWNIRGVQNVQDQLTVGGQQQYGQQTGQQSSRQYGRQTGGQQQPMSASDQKLAQQIQQRIQNQLSSSNVDVSVSRGTATLQGSVQDNSQKQQAEQIARAISGIQSVRNNITIGGQGGEYPALGYVPGQEDQTTGQGAAQQDTGTGIAGDARCIQVFKQGLTNQNLQSIAQNVYVTCHQGNMALYGYVKSNEEKDQLEKATKAVPGIKNVDNNLIVKKEGWQQKSDSEIQQDVESQLWWSPYVDSDKIHVSVQNGVVTLTGQVDNWDAMRAAVKNAYDGGAKRVKSQIQIASSGQQPASQSSSKQSGTDQSTMGGTSGTGSSSGTSGSSSSSESSGTGGSSGWQ